MARLVYADWLEEYGYSEEAERQRLWPAAKEWLVKFCEDNKGDEENESTISYDELIIMAENAYEDDPENPSVSCGNNMTMCDALRENTNEFWEKWSIITGNVLPRDSSFTGWFRCGC